MVVLLAVCNGYAQDFEKMLFPLRDPVTKCIGCVNIKGDTIIPFEFKDCYVRTYFNHQGYDSGYMSRARYSDEELRFLPYNLGWGWLGKANGPAIGLYNGHKFELLRVSSDSIFVIKKNGLVGAVDAVGREVIPCIYDAIPLDHVTMRVFHEIDGLASVLKNGKMGCVNKAGKLVIPCVYDDNVFNFSRTDDNILVAIKNDEEVYINHHGRIVNMPKNNNEPWTVCPGDDNAELRCVEKNGKHGCVDKDGKLVIPFISDTHIFFNNNGNYAAISQGWSFDGINREEGKFGYINRKGEIVIPCKYAYASDFLGKYAIVETYFEQSGKYVAECIDENGNVKRKLGESSYGTDYHGQNFDDQQSLSYGSFTLSANGYWCEKSGDHGYSFDVFDGYVGDKLSSQTFDKPSAFGVYKKGLALVVKYGQTWFINEAGENVLHEKWDRIGTVSLSPLYEVTERLALNDRYLISVKKDLKGLVDIENEIILTPCIYEEIGNVDEPGLGGWYQEQIHHNMVKVKRNGKFGYIDVRTGEEVIPCEYGSASARLKKYQYLYNAKKSDVDENIPVNTDAAPKASEITNWESFM